MIVLLPAKEESFISKEESFMSIILPFTQKEITFAHENKTRCTHCNDLIIFHGYIEQGNLQKCKVCNQYCNLKEVKNINETNIPNGSISLDEIRNSLKIEAVNHPAHYLSGPYEVYKVLNAWGMNFNLGNVIKYLVRHDKKDKHYQVEDLKKAIKYIEFEIERLNNE